jgi:plastocyanin
MRKALLASVLCVALMGGGALTASAGTADAVKVKDNKYRPRRLEVDVGTRVRWTNRGHNPHTVTSNAGLFDRQIDPGERFSRRFKKPGTFKYHCEIHDGMTGRVVVA